MEPRTLIEMTRSKESEGWTPDGMAFRYGRSWVQRMTRSNELIYIVCSSSFSISVVTSLDNVR